MRIVHLITSLGGGGTQNFLFQIVKNSPPAYQHHIFYLGQDGVTGEKLRSLNATVQRTTPWALYRFLKKDPPDALHTCLHWAHQVGRLIGHMAGLPYIVSSHRSIDVWQKPWHRLVDRWTLPYCQAVIVNSETAKSVIERRLAQASVRPVLYRIQNGIDPTRFTLTDRKAARDALGIADDALVAGTLMRLHAEKGAEKIPDFAQLLLKRFPKLILLIGGTGPLETALKKETASWGERIRWVGWQSDAPAFLSALDVFWLLSREESFPQALLEASGAGIPWVAPDVGGIEELLSRGAVGKMATTQTESIAESTAQILNAQRLWLEKAQTASSAIKNHYNLATTIKTFYTIMENRGNSA